MIASAIRCREYASHTAYAQSAYGLWRAAMCSGDSRPLRAYAARDAIELSTKYANLLYANNLGYLVLRQVVILQVLANIEFEMNALISGFNITHYRGIDDLEIAHLGQINLFAGVNNTGKTSILEAIGLMSNPLDRPNFMKWALMRTQFPQDLSKKTADYMEFLFSSNQPIELDATLNKQIHHVTYTPDRYTKYNTSGDLYKVIKITATLLKNENSINKDTFLFRNNGRSSYKKIEGLFKTEFISTHGFFYQNCVKLVSESMLNKKKNQLIEVIQSFDKDISDIMLKNDDILLDSRSIGVQPLFSYGSGLQKAVLLATSLLSAENNVILIDEIDSTMNLMAFKPVFSWFVHKCRELNTQAFITTHSLEAIDAILETANDEQEDDIRVITLRKTPSHRIVAQVRTGNQARSDRERFEMELRV